MACYSLIGLIINHRRKNAVEVQHVLTQYGCNIKMRLGLHEADNVCSEEGLVILQLAGNEAENNDLLNALNELDGVTAKLMSICS